MLLKNKLKKRGILFILLFGLLLLMLVWCFYETQLTQIDNSIKELNKI